MSQGHKFSYSVVKAGADALLDALAPLCERVELAGSLRRHKEFVSDIEVVCIPRLVPGLLGPVRLDMRLAMTGIGAPSKSGPRYIKFDWQGWPVDLFVCTPETWGVNFLIRTGSADFAHWMVTPRAQHGALPSHLRVKDARVWERNRPLDTPEEADVFKLCGLEVIPPEKRIGGWWTESCPWTIKEAQL